MKYSDMQPHRFWFHLTSLDQWYAIMRECRTWFGTNWASMSKVRRKLEPRRAGIRTIPVSVWFDVPDPRFATWISVKHSIQVQSDAKHQAAK